MRGSPEARYGRGMGRVLDGKLANVPLVLQLLHLLQFSTPAGGLDYAGVDFFITQDRVIFERAILESTHQDTAWLQLIGAGEMNLDTFELNARFNSRSAVALLRDTVGGIGDQLVAIEVTGPLWAPEAKLVPLPGMSTPDESMVGTAPVWPDGAE